jgi:hypothetical protein
LGLEESEGVFGLVKYFDWEKKLLEEEALGKGLELIRRKFGCF